MIQKGNKCDTVATFSKALFCSGRRQYTTILCLRGQQSKLSLQRCCGRPDATVHQVVHSAEGATLLIVAHEGMKIVVLRDIGDVSPWH